MICARYFALLYLIWNLYIWAGWPRSSNCCRKSERGITLLARSTPNLISNFEGLPRTKIRNWYLKSAYEHYIVLSNSIVDYLL